MEKSFDRVEDFLSSESFRSWVLKPTPELDKRWLHWLDENQHKQVLVDQAKELILSLKFEKFSSDPKVKQRILDQVRQKSKRSRRISIVNQPWIKVAAVLLLLISATIWIYFNTQNSSDNTLVMTSSKVIQKSNHFGERSEHILPDGSKVYLNAGSSLEYPEVFASNSRLIKLKGEAFFEVEHDARRPFKVKTERFEVVVLGTRFNVNSQTIAPTVALVDGKVLLNSNASDASLELRPNQMAIFNPESESFTPATFDLRYITGWKDGYLVFKESSLDEVVKQLESWYGINVSILDKPTSDWSYTATFKQESLENVLKNMQILRRFTYEIKGDSLLFSFQ